MSKAFNDVNYGANCNSKILENFMLHQLSVYYSKISATVLHCSYHGFHKFSNLVTNLFREIIACIFLKPGFHITF